MLGRGNSSGVSSDRRARVVVVLFLFASLLLVAPTSGLPSRDAGVTVTRDVVYRTIDGERLTLDVYVPAATTRRRPAILLVHGGSWREGDKSDFTEDGMKLAQLGYAAFSINYRLAPAHPYPAAVDDVEAAVGWVRAPAQVKAYRARPEACGRGRRFGGRPARRHARDAGPGFPHERLAHQGRGELVGTDGLQPVAGRGAQGQSVRRSRCWSSSTARRISCRARTRPRRHRSVTSTGPTRRCCSRTRSRSLSSSTTRDEHGRGLEGGWCPAPAGGVPGRPPRAGLRGRRFSPDRRVLRRYVGRPPIAKAG